MAIRPESRTSLSLLGRLRCDPCDPVAWDRFVECYGRKIYHWCRRWGLQDADARDVTQNVLVELVRRIPTFDYDPNGSFRTWLKTLTYWTWNDWVGKHRRPGRAEGFEALATLEARDDLVHQLEEQHQQELLRVAASRVRLRVERHTWDAFDLLTFRGLPGEEVARRLQMKIGTVYVARSKVQKMLRDEIGRLEQVPSLN